MNKFGYLAVAIGAAGLGSYGCSGASEDVTSDTAQAYSSTFQITCESNNNQYNSCGAPGSRIQYARVARQISFAPCNEGQSWGYQQNYVWVNRGCRADFEVTVDVGGGGGGGGGGGYGTIRVLLATYGGNVGVNRGNVNYYLTNACDGRSNCDYYITTSALGDPRPGYAKDFDVLWDCGDKTQTQEAHVSAEANGRHVYLNCGYGPPPPPPPPPPGPACGNLMPGQSLYRDQNLYSCDGRTSFAHQSGGNVVVYHDGNVIFSNNVYAPNDDVLTMQNDGNLVQYTTDRRVLWASNTAGRPGAHLAVQDDCNVVIYDQSGYALWQTGTSGCYQH